MDELNPTAADIQWPSSHSKGTPSSAKGPTRAGLDGLISTMSSGVWVAGGEAGQTMDIIGAAIVQGDGGVVDGRNVASTTSSLMM